MKISNHTNATFAKRPLVREIHLKCILKGFTKTRSPSNVIYVIILLSNMHKLENTLNVSMENLYNTKLLVKKYSTNTLKMV
jgi:hypothetical protein